MVIILGVFSFGLFFQNQKLFQNKLQILKNKETVSQKDSVNEYFEKALPELKLIPLSLRKKTKTGEYKYYDYSDRYSGIIVTDIQEKVLLLMVMLLL